MSWLRPNAMQPLSGGPRECIADRSLPPSLSRPPLFLFFQFILSAAAAYVPRDYMAIRQPRRTTGGTASNCQTGRNIGSGGAAAELILRAMTELCYSHRRTRTTNDDDVGVNISRGSRIARYDLLYPAAAE